MLVEPWKWLVFIYLLVVIKFTGFRAKAWIQILLHYIPDKDKVILLL